MSPCAHHAHSCCAGVSAFEIPQHVIAAALAAREAEDAGGDLLAMNPTSERGAAFPPAKLKPEIEAEMDAMRQVRRLLHSWPEIGFAEVKTAAFIEEQLRKLPGVEVHTKIGVTGLIGMLVINY